MISKGEREVSVHEPACCLLDRRTFEARRRCPRPVKLEQSGGFVGEKCNGLGIACGLAQGHVGRVGFAFAIVGHGFDYCAPEWLDWAGIGGAKVHGHINASRKASNGIQMNSEGPERRQG